MQLLFKWVLPTVAAFALVGGLAATSARAADEKSTIKGKVVDKDGKAVAEARVILAKARQRGAGGGGRPEPLAEATTKDDGTFVLEIDKTKVPEGDYTVSARKQGVGNARVNVKIDKDGKPDKADLGELKLQQGGRRGGGGGGA